MGVHTGDSITVAPALTLTDREYQQMRDVGIAVIREVGVDTGGCNIQFAVDPGDRPGHRHRDEPARLALQSALASKATGFPIAKIAAKLAIGYTLDEIPNDITSVTPACFEPTLDYVVVKVPRFAFEKFPGGRPDADHDDEVASARRWRSAATSPRRCRRRCASLEKQGAALPLGRRPARRSGPTTARAMRAAPTDGRLVIVQQALRGRRRRVERASPRPPASTRGSSTRSC